MNRIDELIKRLRSLEITLWLDGDQLGLRASKGVITPALAQELKSNKSELIAFLQQAEQSNVAETVSIPIAPRFSHDDSLRTPSFGQQRLWFLDRLEGPSSTYNMSLVIQLDGEVKLDAIQYALDQIVSRHEVLRSHFKIENQELAVWISPETTCTLRINDAPFGKNIEDQIKRQITTESSYPFDLAKDALIRASVTPLADQTLLFCVTMHHIVSDGWSLGIFTREFTSLYKAYREKRNSSLAPIDIQYSDFAYWQRQQLSGVHLINRLDYWKERLADAPDILNLPTDFPRPALVSYKGQSLTRSLESTLVKKLSDFSQLHGCTLYMTMLTGFALLMQRYSGQADIVLGTAVANRTHQALEPLMGLFTNTLALRLDLTGHPSAAKLVEQIKKTCLSAYEHQDIPFEQIVEALNPPRHLNYSPVFQVSFDLQNAPTGDLKMSGVTLKPIEQEAIASKFDLSLSIEQRNNILAAAWTWNTDLFAQSTIEHMHSHYALLLENLVHKPYVPADSLPLFDYSLYQAVQQQRSAQEYQDYPEAQTWLDLFQEQAHLHPTRTALSVDDSSLSYEELLQRVNALARKLISQGIKKENLVAVFMDRSIDMVVALLAVMRAGAAYIPLDPSFPTERLKWVFEDAQPVLTLTQRNLVLRIPNSSTPSLCLDEINVESNHEAGISEITFPDIDPENAAYVIFTSGSSGRPKGVLVHHQALLNFLLSMASTPGLNDQDTLLAVTTISFDIAALELYLPLAQGAHLVVAPREAAINAQQLQNLIEKHHVTHMQATPTTWRLLLDTQWRPAPRFTVLCGGEALPSDLSAKLLATGVKLWNLYGPTETTIWSAAHQIQQAADPALSPNEAVGPAIRNTQIYILDAYGQALPPGIAGELCIAGDGLARGYVGRPDLTALAYQPNPYSDQHGARLYRTGDLAREKKDGTFEFLGRIDNQVKLRGYRIELGDIEQCFREQTGIREAVVILREDTPGDKRLVAYVVPKANSHLVPETLRKAIRATLPEYMVPAHVVVLETIPVTPNGKINRKALPKPEPVLSATQSKPSLPTNALERGLLEIWQDVLQKENIGLHDNFFDLGGHSILLTRVFEQIVTTFKETLDTHTLELVSLFQYPTIATLAAHLGQKTQNAHHKKFQSRLRPIDDQSIAIIGMSARLPGANDVETFWSNLLAGEESIRFFSRDEIIAAGVDPAEYNAPTYVPAHGALEHIENFDATFFDYTPAQARVIDPQQRLFLETSWHALEHGGYGKIPEHTSVGVFAGCGQNDYLVNQVLPYLEHCTDTSAYEAILGNDKDFLATRVSYALNLTGPSLDVQTACSTSLVAIHMACRSLLDGECEMAIAGGVALRVPQHSGHVFQPGMIVSSDGHCRAFDAQAEGTVWGSGVGAVLLKPLAQALKDRDTIHAVIKGSAINNDGAMKVGFTAPSVDGQAQVISSAQARAGVSPESIGYIETHGTATALGDLIEFAALNQVFKADTSAKNFCVLGSVKTNIGHLNSAAGIAGLIKTTLALKHGQIPATLHFTQPNPKIDFASSPFYVSNQTLSWPEAQQPRRAGVSSFGIGGTNAHAVLEQAPSIDRTNETKQPLLLVLSARSESALNQLRQDLASHFKNHPQTRLADAAWTLAVGRKEFDHRCALVCDDLDSAIEQLQAPKSPIAGVLSSRQSDQSLVAMMFPGQGSQYAGMGHALYIHHPIFRAQFDMCADLLLPHLKLDLRTALFDNSGDSATTLNETWLTQPALFAVEYALAQVWLASGVKPNALIGHSLGEYVAACLAGVFDLETALRLVTVRGRLIWQETRGAMLAVSMTASQLTALLPSELSLAAVNGPEACVVAGSFEAIDAFEKILVQQNVLSKRLQTSHAFHSSMLDGILPQFRQEVAACSLQVPQIPFISNVTGAWITDEQATSPEYWAAHMRQAVNFDAGLATLFEQSPTQVIEAGPGHTLSSLARRHRGKPVSCSVISSFSHQASEYPSWLENLGKIWCSGITPDWHTLMDASKPYRIALPQYPFERARHWIESSSTAIRARLAQPDVKLPFEEWFYLPDWQQTLPPASDACANTRSWLVFANDSVLSKELLERFAHHNLIITIIRPGDIFKKISDQEWLIRPGEARDYVELLATEHALTFDTILLLWGMPQAPAHPLNIDQSLINIALGLDSLRQPHTHIVVMTPPFHYVNGTETIDPLLATLTGPLLVIPQEMPHISMHCIDIELPVSNRPMQQRVMDLCWRELHTDQFSASVALRQDRRYVLGFKHIDMLKVFEGSPAVLRPQGVYLITGGLGRMGLVLAEYLAKQVQARLILISRSPLPARDQWQSLAGDTKNQTQTAHTIRTILRIENLGAEVLVIPADVSHTPSMKRAFEISEQRFGNIHGVIHAAGAPSAIQTIADMAADPLSVNVESKISGTNILFELLAGRKADFCILMSSSAALLGGLAFTSYTASNAYLDAFAEYANRLSDTHWLSINWDAWEYENSGTIPPQEAAFWMKAAEATEAFHRILLNMPSGRIAVASADLQARYLKWSSPSSSRASDMPLVQHERPNLSTTFSAPASATETALAEIWCSLLGYSEIGRSDDFFELGGDSMLGIRMIGAVSQRLGHQLPLTIFLERPTIQSMAQSIDQDLSAFKFTPLVSMQTAGDHSPLFCVPGTGGSVLYLTNLARGFGKVGRPFYGLQAKGLDGNATPLDKIEDIAALNISTIKTVQPQGPYYLCGHSFGCWVALEMARQLVLAGDQVARLIVLDAGTPSGRDLSAMSGWDNSKWLMTVAETISHMYEKPLYLPMESIANLDWNDQISALADQLVSQKIIDSQNNVELVRGIIEVFKTQAQIIYDPPFEPRLPISMFRAKDVLDGFLDGMPEHLKNDEVWGWGQYAQDQASLVFVEGDHLTMVSRQYATRLAEIIHKHLGENQR